MGENTRNGGLKNPAEAGEMQAKRNDKGQFLPGISGNPEGKKNGTRNFTTKMREALAELTEKKDGTYEDALKKAILYNAIIAKKPETQKLIWEQLDGKPVQKIDQITQTLNDDDDDRDDDQDIESLADRIFARIELLRSIRDSRKSDGKKSKKA